ncbi:hypothetical protein DDT56_08485 [Brenneria corticis]|uniref:Uncharacterized protein n=2 Tax=Brenneria TaxID=71655 RepID=A0ABX5UUX8_9GAMM|nr:hypothetical protein DDT56_08485 [Brenneria sp. CFCC 11842]QCR03279.1 hypothetical protein EH206_03060 [Brenneria nigrifluens DSM 30175 = ATCC 13028]
MPTKLSVSLRYTGLPYRGALRRLTPLRPLATLSLISNFIQRSVTSPSPGLVFPRQKAITTLPRICPSSTFR